MPMISLTVIENDGVIRRLEDSDTELISEDNDDSIDDTSFPKKKIDCDILLAGERLNRALCA